MIVPVQEEDFEAWLALAKEVEPLFGPMVDSPDFQAGIKASIRDHAAFCAKDPSGRITGIIALDRGANEIAWLAVGKIDRGKRYGMALLQKAVAELEPQGDIHVQTFAPGIESGASAIRLYESMGFAVVKDGGKNPAGMDTVIMTRKTCRDRQP